MNADQTVLADLPKSGPIASWKAERLYRREHPVAWWVSMVSPFVLVITVFLFVTIARGLGAALRMSLTSVAIVLVFGKLIIAGGHLDEASESVSFYSPEELVGIALYTDLVVTSIVVFHMGLLFRLPLIGARLEALVSAARSFLDSNSWMMRLTFVGLIGFTALPVTGGLSGAIMGRLLGMGRLPSFVCVMLGSMLGCGLVYFFGELVMKYFGNENPLFLLIGLLIVVVGLIFAYRWYRVRHRPN